MEVVGEAVVGELVQNLISLVKGEVRLLRSVEGNVGSLSSKLTTIQAVLEDAENTQFKNKAITVWLRNLKNAVYDAEDVLDEWIAGTPQVVNTGCMDQVSNSVSACFNLNRIRFRHKIANKLTEILSRFDDIVAEKSNFDLKINDGPRSEPLFDKSRETTSNITEPCVYGRDVDKENVTLALLKHVGTQDDVFIFPIIGMGGLGKTTLAQMVFNDKKVIAHFEVRSWVCVSEPFDVKRILKALIEASITDTSNKEPCDLKTLESIKNNVHEILKGKRFLLVLDDVWTESQSEWNKLKSFLKGGAQGSSIILTTRLERVASITSVVKPYNVGVLSDDDSWALLRHYAFGGRGEEEYPNRVEIGKEIMKKCKGVPLALKSLGSLLFEEKRWESIRDSEMWELKQEGDKSILPALKLSYNHLPSCLKLCFAYCSIFPKDYDMDRDVLVRLWIANGFIQSQETSQLEEVGEDIFNELLRRSFFQEGQEDDSGIETYTIHDLMHDLAVSVALDECLAVKVGESTKHIPKTIRHLRVNTDSSRLSTLANPPLTPHSSLRTLLFFDSIDFNNFKFSNTLRVLDLTEMKITKLPPSIFLLKLLRYLDLSGNDIRLVPESICKLKNLQSLNLCDNRNLETLPSSIVKVEPLRHLDLSLTSIASLPESFHSLKSLRCLNLSHTPITSLPESIFMLTNLHTLDLEENRGIRTLPPGIGKLVNLRHLNLGDCSSLVSIPETVCDLTNLQSLLLTDIHVKIPIGIGKLTSLRTLGGIPFILGNPDSGGVDINELQRLNQLRGKLKIRGLQNVRNAEEARTANLGSKQYLTKLKLYWSYSDDEDGDEDRDDDGGSDEDADDEDGDDDRDDDDDGDGDGDDGGDDGGSDEGDASYSNEDGEDDDSDGDDDGGSLQVKKHNNNRSKEVLEGLLFHPHPPPNLQSLKICEYGAEELPQELQKLTSLTRFTIEDCVNIKCLPVIGVKDNSNYISSLLDLKIRSCWGLTSVSEGLRYLTSLQQLEISDCPKLLDLLTQEEDEGKDVFQYLISLENLVLDDLPQLTALPEGIQRLSMLKTLHISGCKNLTSVSQGLRHLTSLQQLEISDCPKLLELVTEEDGKDVFQYLVSLEKLVLEDLPQFRALPLGIQSLPMLKTLEISEWKNLTSVSQGLRYLTSLQQLKISDCPKLLELVTQEEEGKDVFQYLVSLDKLVLEKLPQLTALPEGIQCLTTLQKLIIGDCENLTSVSEGLRYLTSLQQLKISDCPKLELVTQEEDGFQHLISLHKLVLEDLPQLTALPEWIQCFSMLKILKILSCENLSVLPEWLKCLTTLQALDIYRPHPDLEVRCEENKGKDWHKISHIPDVLIYPKVQTF